jgi:hypothetical protein
MRWMATMCYARVLDQEVLVSTHAISSRTASSAHRFWRKRYQRQSLINCVATRPDSHRGGLPSHGRHGRRSIAGSGNERRRTTDVLRSSGYPTRGSTPCR